MTGSSDLGSGRAELERTILRAFLQFRGQPAELPVALSAGHFAEPLHQVLFAELQAMLPGHGPLHPAELQSRLTRRGFPDVDLTPFFEPTSISESELASLCQSLRDEDGGFSETPLAGNTSK